MSQHPSIPIIDAHHHLWDPSINNHPWLSGNTQIPFRYGDYSAIRNPFLVADYQEISRNWNIVGTVTMEGEWDPADPLGEVAWLSGLRETEGWPRRHAAQAWLDSPDVGEVLEALSAHSYVRSVRHKPLASEKPSGEPGGMTDPRFRHGFSLLKNYQLHFDLQTPWWHLHEVEGLIKHNDTSLVVLNHTGLPSDRSAEGLAAWKKAMTRLAALEQTRVKISGLGLSGAGWDAEGNQRIIRDTIEIFGPGRCMFASNFPVDSLVASFDEIFSGFVAATHDLSDTEQQALFSGTASEVYDLSIA